MAPYFRGYHINWSAVKLCNTVFMHSIYVASTTNRRQRVSVTGYNHHRKEFYVEFYVLEKQQRPASLQAFVLYGAGTRNRTRDLLITSQLLYHLSYTGVSGRRL